MDFSVSVIPSSSQQTLEFYTVGKIHLKAHCNIQIFEFSRQNDQKYLLVGKFKVKKESILVIFTYCAKVYSLHSR